jgi:CRP/FNR family transcriptional regulator, cyclic AMP receptor protein
MQKVTQKNPQVTPRLEGITKTIKAGGVIYSEGESVDSLVFIHSGFVKLYTTKTLSTRSTKSPHGVRLLDVMGAHDVIGFGEGEQGHTAVAATETTVTFLQRNYIKNEHNARALLRHYDRISDRHGRRQEASEYTVVGRFAVLCRELAERFDDGTGVSMPLPLTHDDIADLTSSSRVTITRFAEDFSDKNILNRVGNGKYSFSGDGVDEVILQEMDAMFGGGDVMKKTKSSKASADSAVDFGFDDGIVNSGADGSLMQLWGDEVA